MIFVDTGFFIARASPNDALHKTAVTWERHAGAHMLVTEYVLLEVVNYLSLPMLRAKGHLIVSLIRANPAYTVLSADADWFDRGMKMHIQRPDKGWSLTDCISFEVMRDRGVTQALTYDHHFEQAGFEALLRRDPP